MNNPYFSIIMACYNADQFLAKSIQSVVNQSFKEIELIIVDDCSNDNSFNIASNFSKIDSRIKVFKNKSRSGPANTRNTAILKSKGKWLSIIDADDIFFPEKLESQLELISKNNENLILVGAGSYAIDEYDKRLWQFTPPGDSNKLKYNLIRGKKFPGHSTIVYKRRTAVQIGGYNPKFHLAHDYDLWLRLSKLGDFTCYTKPLVGYRLHSNNISKKIISNSQFTFGIASRVCYLLRQRGLYDPSMGQNQSYWEHFVNCVEKTIYDNGELEYRRWKKSFIDTVVYKFNKISNENIYQLLSHPKYFYKFWYEYFHGGTITEKCYQKWISTISNHLKLA